ncbi:olfactory receptor 4C15-like [Tachyglossus aculeatus]|uniref:olfactory receptor 4C15-like n=1 Tax=Tachyglossus aculeatus TaxID=9261 RepID=UPI0018F75F68|nr:olfactory receptor 4C15-like [Tachyglossus aculeatus]
MTELILLGMLQKPEMQKTQFVVLLFVYLVTVGGNMLIMTAITTSHSLLALLSFLDSCFSSVVAPKMIVDSLSERKTFSYEGCMAQLFAEHFFAGVEVFALTVMAYNRCVAICNPPHYVTIMSQQTWRQLMGLAWDGGFLHSMIQFLFMFWLPFCSPKLACIEAHIPGLLVIANSGMSCIVNVSLLIIYYGVILCSLKPHSSEGRRKALSTCGAHITPVFFFFVPCIFISTRPPATFSDKMVVNGFQIATGCKWQMSEEF